MTEMPSIDVQDLPTDAVLLDVREDDEWQAGHAPQATHVPLGQVPQRLDELPADGVVHVVCRAGGRSAQATDWLNRNGYEAVNVAGGMQAWQSAGLPLVSETDAAPTVV